MSTDRIPLDYPPDRRIFGGTTGRSTRDYRPAARASSARGRSSSTASVFGGRNGGMGPGVPIPAIIAPIAAAAAATDAAIPVTGMTTPVATGPLTLTHFGSSIDKAGAEIMNTFGSIIPLAIKVIIVIIVIKIILWLIKRRR